MERRLIGGIALNLVQVAGFHTLTEDGVGGGHFPPDQVVLRVVVRPAVVVAAVVDNVGELLPHHTCVCG